MSDTRSLSLFVFIDALGWELLQSQPFLTALAPVRRPIETVLGYSCTCDPTILTGRLPREHDHFSFFVYDPARSPFSPLPCQALRLLPTALTDRARIRHRISRLWGRALGVTGYFNLYAVPFAHLPQLDYTERHDLYQPGGIRGGQKTFFDDLRQAHVPYFLSDWRRDDTTNVAALRTVLQAEHPRVAYLYLAGLDGILHADGTRSPRVTEKLAWYENALTELVALAQERYETVRLHVFSDHGMTNVTATCDLMRQVDALGLTWGKDYAAVYDSTMARFWFLSDRARQLIPAALAQEPQGHILSCDELERFGCNFANHRYGELFFLLNPGVLLCPSFMGTRPIRGMHGYDPTHSASTASYLSNVAVAPAPKHLTDLYPLMRQEAGLLE